MDKFLNASQRLFNYIIENHWDGSGLMGPDPGLRYNFRIFRFIKSYLSSVKWKDNFYFLQCQGYWVFDNSMMNAVTNEDKYLEIIRLTADRILDFQAADGSWQYPLPEWKGKIATVEGNYGARALIESFRKLRDERYLAGALKWYDFLTEKTGFQFYKDSLSINYFAGIKGRLVPNNATLTLAFLSELYRETKDLKHLKYSEEMIRFLKYAQKESGELPYAFEIPGTQGREHFLCFQYNSFQLMDLATFYNITQNKDVYDVLKGLARFISTGVEKDGHSRYNCFKSTPIVPYYTAAIAAALLTADNIGLGDYAELSDRAYSFLLKTQNKRGGFYYSKNNYKILKDRRSYPRYLVMILKHLLMKAESLGAEMS